MFSTFGVSILMSSLLRWYPGVYPHVHLHNPTSRNMVLFIQCTGHSNGPFRLTNFRSISLRAPLPYWRRYTTGSCVKRWSRFLSKRTDSGRRFNCFRTCARRSWYNRGGNARAAESCRAGPSRGTGMVWGWDEGKGSGTSKPRRLNRNSYWKYSARCGFDAVVEQMCKNPTTIISIFQLLSSQTCPLLSSKLVCHLQIIL